MNLLFRLAAAATIVFALVVPATAASVEYPPGSRVGLVPPPGMTASTRFPGFEGRGAILSVTELSGQSYPARRAGVHTPRPSRRAAWSSSAATNTRCPGGPAAIVAARHDVSGVPMRKWALSGLVGDVTVIVILTMPEDLRGTYPDDAVRASLMSVMVRPKLSQEELLAVLPYRLADLGGFHLMRATPNGMATLTFGPNDTPLPVEQPYFMVVWQSLRPPAAEYENFARRAFAEFSNGGGRIMSSEAMRIAGEPGYQMIAESKDTRTGDELVTVQWMRFSDGTVQMIGIARKDQWEAVLPRMRAVARRVGGEVASCPGRSAARSGALLNRDTLDIFG